MEAGCWFDMTDSIDENIKHPQRLYSYAISVYCAETIIWNGAAWVVFTLFGRGALIRA